MTEKMILQVVGFVIEKSVDTPAVKELLKNVGKQIKETIPGDHIEPQLGRAMDYIKEGMLEVE